MFVLLWGQFYPFNVLTLLYGSALFVFFRCVRKITPDDWSLIGPIFYHIGLPGPIRFLFRTDEFWRENLRAYFNEIYGELSIIRWKILDNKMCWNTSATFFKVIIMKKYDKQWSTGGHKKQSEQVTRTFQHVKVWWHRGRYVEVHRAQTLRKIIYDDWSSIMIYIKLCMFVWIFILILSFRGCAKLNPSKKRI